MSLSRDALLQPEVLHSDVPELANSAAIDDGYRRRRIRVHLSLQVPAEVRGQADEADGHRGSLQHGIELSLTGRQCNHALG